MIKVLSIVVTYNGRKWVEKCFGSLVNSKIDNHRILAIDNGSTDGTVELIRSNFPDVEIIETGENLGFGKANNIGLSIAIKEKADFVFLLNQDAWLKDEYDLTTLANQMESDSEIGICSPIQFNSKNKLDLLFKNYLKGFIDDSENIIQQNKSEYKCFTLDYVNAASWMISKRCLQLCGGFAPIFQHYGEDNNYTDRVKYHELKLVVFPGVGIIHDRPQQRLVNLEAEKYLLRLNMMYVSYLMNINHTIFCAIIQVFGMTVVKTFRFIFLMKFDKIIIPIKSLLFGIGSIKEVLKQRRHSKSDSAFL